MPKVSYQSFSLPGAELTSISTVPMDLALAVAQGFHNAPRLYGDSTVRTPRRISGMKSGLRAAGEEFAFGVYDGVTGLVLQPYNGVKKDGVKGLVPGIGKGLFGFVLKDLAAIIGPVGYTLKGVHKEMVKGKQPTAFIRRARVMLGGKDKASLKKVKLQEIEARVEKAWAIVMEIMKEIDRTKEEGLSSRWAIARERRRLEKTGAFESVETAEQAFQMWKREREGERERESAAPTTNTTVTTAQSSAPTATERRTPSRDNSRTRKEMIASPAAVERRTPSRGDDPSRSRSRSRSRNRKEVAAHVDEQLQLRQQQQPQQQRQDGIPNGVGVGVGAGARARVNGTPKKAGRNESFMSAKSAV